MSNLIPEQNLSVTPNGDILIPGNLSVDGLTVHGSLTLAEGTSAGGLDGQLQFNDDGSLAGSPVFTMDGPNSQLFIKDINDVGAGLSICSDDSANLYFKTSDGSSATAYLHIGTDTTNNLILYTNNVQAVSFNADQTVDFADNVSAAELHSALLFDASGNEIMNIANMELYDNTLKIAASWSPTNRKLYSDAEVVAMDWSTGALVFPLMTTGERDALIPTAGMVVYNTTTNKLNVYTTTWEVVTSA